MGYSHGTSWSDERIISDLRLIMEENNMQTMPTTSEIESFFGDTRLTNAISKHGGTKRFADMLNLDIKECESAFGERYELLCIEQIRETLGLPCKKMKRRYPYDILVDDAVKVDVKASHLYKKKDECAYYTFNLEKKAQTCDMYVCYCLDVGGEVAKTLVIPSTVMSSKTQLSVGKRSTYDRYVDAWNLISIYHKFMKSFNEGVKDNGR